jgi:light-regulated signal transduction histidine kinase (bacteriophytochrome)
MSKEITDTVVCTMPHQQVLDQMPIGLLIVQKNNDGDLINDTICKYGNLIANTLIGIDEIIGRRVSEIFGDNIVLQENFPVEVWFPFSEKWGLINLSKGNFREYLVSITDITTQKNAAIHTEAKITKLQRSNQDLEYFAYVASHDLKEPLRKIVSFGERLEIKAKDILQTEHLHYLNRMISASRRMQRLIDHLLEYSKVTRKQDDFKKVDLNIVLKKVLDLFQEEIVQKNAILTFVELPVVEGDEIQLTTLIQNLLSNSIKFTRSTLQPKISIEVFIPCPEMLTDSGLNKHLNYIAISVTDNGIGFQVEQAGMIFALFNRLRGRSEYEGAGLGLAICKRVVENHQGAIFAKGFPDAGAEFTVILPLKQNN